jgi:hypothetical protein
MSALRHIVIVAALIVAATLSEARTAMAAEGDKSAERYVSVSATGSVATDPDMATISTGVIVEADTAKDALARNSTVMAKLIDGLKALGIAPKDIQTANLSLQPIYDYSGNNPVLKRASEQISGRADPASAIADRRIFPEGTDLVNQRQAEPVLRQAEMLAEFKRAIFLVAIYLATPATPTIPGQARFEAGQKIFITEVQDAQGKRLLALFTDHQEKLLFTDQTNSTLVMPAKDAMSFALEKGYTGLVVNPATLATMRLDNPVIVEMLKQAA